MGQENIPKGLNRLRKKARHRPGALKSIPQGLKPWLILLGLRHDPPRRIVPFYKTLLFCRPMH